MPLRWGYNIITDVIDLNPLTGMFVKLVYGRKVGAPFWNFRNLLSFAWKQRTRNTHGVHSHYSTAISPLPLAPGFLRAGPDTILKILGGA